MLTIKVLNSIVLGSFILLLGWRTWGKSKEI